MSGSYAFKDVCLEGYSRAMEQMARRVAREVKAMTRRETITKAIDGQISWVAAADIIRVTPRHMRRMRQAIERGGMSAVMDQRGGRPRRKRIAVQTIREMCRLKREVYPHFSIRHFYELLAERHRIAVSSHLYARSVTGGRDRGEGARARPLSAPARAPPNSGHAGPSRRVHPSVDCRFARPGPDSSAG